MAPTFDQAEHQQHGREVFATYPVDGIETANGGHTADIFLVFRRPVKLRGWTLRRGVIGSFSGNFERFASDAARAEWMQYFAAAGYDFEARSGYGE